MRLRRNTFTFLFLLFAVMLAGACTSLSSRPVAGALQGDLVWSGSVVLRGDVILQPGSRLVVAPGTTVLFAPPRPGEDTLVDHPHFSGSELIVRGTLVAEGRPDAPITFAHLDPDAPAGSWGGINLQQSPGASFSYCRFLQADSALHSQESTVSVEQSIFEDNLVGIRFHTSAIRIENNLLHRNGTAIRFHFGAPVILRNEIRENGKGFFISADPRDFRIEENNIHQNREFNVVLGEEVPLDVPMPGNWWGASMPEQLEETFFDKHRDRWLGRVLIKPACASPVAAAGVSWSR